MRMISFLPSATEIVYALGLEDQLAGVTHECDYPPNARNKPVAVRSALDMAGLGQEAIDQRVREAVHAGKGLYAVDEALLKKAEPDLILTQDLCQVCAPSGNEIAALLKSLHKKPEILWLTPTRLEDIFDNIQSVGAATDKAAEAEALVAELRHRVKTIQDRAARLRARPRVFFMEWLAPPYCGGHWVGEMIALAGGGDPFAVKGGDSVRIAWEAIQAAAPDILVLSPCGFNLAQCLAQAKELTRYPGWQTLPAVQKGRVYAVDANSYFARPGPRVVDGIELLAHLFHPEDIEWTGRRDAFRKLDVEALASPASLK